MIEQNWSGKGQHVEYSTSEKSLLRSILQVEDTLGSTSTALVESVKCRRILLARKTVRCNRRITKEIAIDEVAHLSRFNHAHIVRVIGTYSMGETLSILMYPVADWNLETFLSYLDSGQPRGRDLDMMRSAVYTFFNCLTNTVAYIHRSLTKHMDIKPQNILVRDCRHWGITPCYKVYITDFGIARSYTSLDVSETEGPTMFTRRYAAPEVVDGQKRGLPADIFSLGCVFLEMAAVLLTKDGNSCLQRLKDRLAHNEYGDTSYQANLSSCYRFIQLDIYGSNLGSVNLKLTYIGSHMYKMLTRDPAKRPSASELTEMTLLKSRDCCSAGAEPFEVAREATDDTVDPKDSTVTMPPTPRPRPSKDLTAIKRPKPKRRSDVPPQIPSPTPVSPLTLHQLTTPPHSPEWDNHQHKNFISESNL
jgi:serine/threonine protein kinase